MLGFTRVKCTSCEQVIHVSSSDIPRGLRPGEWFERRGGCCEEGQHMELVEGDDEKKGK